MSKEEELKKEIDLWERKNKDNPDFIEMNIHHQRRIGELKGFQEGKAETQKECGKAINEAIIRTSNLAKQDVDKLKNELFWVYQNVLKKYGEWNRIEIKKRLQELKGK